MHEKKSFTQRAEEFLNGKGFYIVLFVCIAVIGVSAWLLLFSQYSPLRPGDEGDYLDAMGNVAEAMNPIDVPDNKETENSGDTPPKETTQPEHRVPEPAEPQDETDALTVQDKPTRPAPDPEPEKPEADPEGEMPTTTTMSVSDISFIWPVSGTVTMAHSPAALTYDRTMGDWRTHDGIDVTVKLGTKVVSAANGTVTEVFDDDYYGTIVVIDHGAGVVTTYANLAGMPTVLPGDAVTMGSVIGSVGTTALYETGDEAHLHLAMTVNGESVDPMDYLPRK